MTSADSLTTNAVEISAKETSTAFFQVCPVKKLVHPIYGVMSPKFHCINKMHQSLECTDEDVKGYGNERHTRRGQGYHR